MDPIFSKTTLKHSRNKSPKVWNFDSTEISSENRIELESDSRVFGKLLKSQKKNPSNENAKCLVKYPGMNSGRTVAE